MIGTKVQLYKSNAAKEDYLHKSIKLFLNEVYSIMKECYGPYGSHILIGSSIIPEATKDGRTILSKIKTNATISTAVHGSIMSVAEKQVSEVGDGSTTTILLLCKLYDEFRNLIDKHKISQSVFNAKLRTAVNLIKEELKNISTNIVEKDGDNYIINFDELYKAIHTSVDGEVELAKTITNMFKELNSIEPLVLIEMSTNEEHRYELVKGTEVEGTVIRPDVFFGGFSRKEFNMPRIVVVNGRLDIKLEDFITCAEESIREDTDTIFLCTGMNEDLFDAIDNLNTYNPGLFTRTAVFQIRRTAHNDEFYDMCALLGASPIDSDSFKRAANYNVVKKLIVTNSGSAEKALLTEFCARFNSPKSNDEMVKQRLNIINEMIEDLEKDPTSHNERIIDLETRKAALSRHYAKFYVGGYSPQRKAINYELANDGIPQAISCMKHGVVKGCNTVVPLAINILTDKVDDNIVCDIMQSILISYNELFEQIVENKYGSEAKEIVSKHKSLNGNTAALNIRTGDDTEVINSADTDRAILENSTDMAALLATAKAFISTNIEFDVVNKGLSDFNKHGTDLSNINSNTIL